MLRASPLRTCSLVARRCRPAASRGRRAARQLPGARVAAAAHRGGEGVKLMNMHRGISGGGGGGGDVSDGYWLATLLAAEGRGYPSGPMAAYMAYSAAVVAGLLVLDSMGALDSFTKSVGTLQSAVNTIGVALFFLMGFRTNSSYGTWLEGLKLWGDVARPLLSLGSTLAAGSVTDKSAAEAIMRWAAGFAYTLKCAQRDEDFLGEPGAATLEPAERDALRGVPFAARPMFCANQIMSVSVDAFKRDQLLAGAADLDRLRGIVDSFVGCIPAMSRVMTTPMPFAYVVHLRSFMVVWLMAMPALYAQDFGWWTLPVCFFIGYALLGMEAISLEVEAPFGRDFNDLPLDDLVDGMVASAMAASGDVMADEGAAGGSVPVTVGASNGRNAAGN